MKRHITYSPAYTLVPTYECFNQCSYCNFRVEPGTDRWLTLAETQEKLNQVNSAIEILVLSGEVHPQSQRRGDWRQRIQDICQLAIENGFLPHTNAGPLSFEEMSSLKQVNVSMGLMLEQLTPRLMDNVHRHAPSKKPDIRRQQLDWAGRLRIPFTTGLLLGIGETVTDWDETLGEIAVCHYKYGHIQEVILQPHQPGTRQHQLLSSFDDSMLLKAVKRARQELPNDIAIQIPPNLVQATDTLIACLDAGVTDLGGIGPIDEVNPTYSHHTLKTLGLMLDKHGYKLKPRLPIYPQYDHWLPPMLKSKVQSWRTQLDFYEAQTLADLDSI